MGSLIKALLLTPFTRSGKDSIEPTPDKPLSPSKYVVVVSSDDAASGKTVALTEESKTSVLFTRRIAITDEEAIEIAKQLRKAEKRCTKAPERKAAINAANDLYRKQLLEDFSSDYPGMTAEEIQAVLADKGAKPTSSR